MVTCKTSLKAPNYTLKTVHLLNIFMQKEAYLKVGL